MAERVLFDHADLAHEPLGIEEARLGEIGYGIAVENLADREVVAAGAGVADEADAEESLRIERANDEDGSIVLLAGAIELVADIDADGAPPDFARVIEGAIGAGVDPLLAAVPTIEVFQHTGAGMIPRCGRLLGMIKYSSMRDPLKEAIEALLNLPRDRQERAARAIIHLAREIEEEQMPVE